MSGAARDAERPGRGTLTFAQRLIVLLGPLLIRALYATWRIRVLNDAGWRARRARGEPYLLALWHGQMLPLVIQHRGEGIAILISEHRDGELIAQIAQRLGLDTVRGSTSRGATRALLGLSKALQEGKCVAVTPDGPRGPVRSFASGALIAAQRASAPIVAIGVYASHAWRLRSWDAFLIPKPFARVVFAYSDPIFVDAPDARSAVTETARFQSLMADVEWRARSHTHKQANDLP